jgi:hypothetical protein
MKDTEFSLQKPEIRPNVTGGRNETNMHNNPALRRPGKKWVNSACRRVTEHTNPQKSDCQIEQMCDLGARKLV